MGDFDTNLVAKPDFEDGQMGDWSAIGGAAASIVDVAGQTFTKALQIVAAAVATSDGQELQTSNGEAKATIYISGWLQTLNSTADASAAEYVLDANDTAIDWPGTPLAAGTDWTEVSGSAVLADAAASIASRVIFHAAAAGDTILVGPQVRSYFNPAYPSFVWMPSYTPKQAREPRLLEASFGDGYTQRAADGINNNRQTWNLEFHARDRADAEAIMDFLSARGGVELFQWVNPSKSGYPNMAPPDWFRCKKYDWSRTSALNHTVTAEFLQEFDPT